MTPPGGIFTINATCFVFWIMKTNFALLLPLKNKTSPFSFWSPILSWAQKRLNSFEIPPSSFASIADSFWQMLSMLSLTCASAAQKLFLPCLKKGTLTLQTSADLAGESSVNQPLKKKNFPFMPFVLLVSIFLLSFTLLRYALSPFRIFLLCLFLILAGLLHLIPHIPRIPVTELLDFSFFSNIFL